MKANEYYEGPPRVLFLSPYPPPECSLANFTYDLVKAIRDLLDSARVSVIAITTGDKIAQPLEVVFEIRQGRLNDYHLAAEYANYSAIDVVCVQYESGMFDGAEGRYLAEFLNRSRKPVVTTLREVPAEPSQGCRDCLARVASLSDRLVVLDSRAISVLKNVYNIPEEKTGFIQQMTWPEMARQYMELFERVAAGPRPYADRFIPGPSSVRFILPQIKLDHLLRMTDDTGVFRRATYGAPDRRSGYSSETTARALVAALMHFNKYGDARALDLASKYLSFLEQAQMPDGDFYNLMSYDRQFPDEGGSEDTPGCALYGLGAAVVHAPDERMRALARTIFERGLEALDLHQPRAIAYAICGLSSFLRRYETATAARRRLLSLGDDLVKCFERSSDEGWRWFSEEMTYANAKMPQGMLLAYQATGIERFKRIGLESLDFFLDVTYRKGYFDFIGNRGWYRQGGERAIFNQQPIEAACATEACLAAYEITGQRRYLDAAQAAAEWVLGRNQLSAKLYDFDTGACADGLEPYGPGMNQGAESAVSAMLALLAITAERNDASESSMPNVSAAETVAPVLGEFVPSHE